MLELIINLMWTIIGVFAGFAVVYSLVRLVAIAWHKTKSEYETDFGYLDHSDYDEEYPERKHQNDEES